MNRSAFTVNRGTSERARLTPRPPVVLALLAACGCATIPVPSIDTMREWSSADAPDPLAALAPGEQVEMSAALAAAAAASARIGNRQAGVWQAAAEHAEAGAFESPEVRFGMGRGSERTMESAYETFSQSGWETDSDSGSKVRSSEETTVSERREFGFLTESSQSVRQSSEASDRTGTSYAQSQSSGSTLSGESSNMTEDGLQVGLRLHKTLAEVSLRRIEVEMERALSELQFCLAAGLYPVKDVPPR